MTRGRKKDLSIPASRALTQQRDYRARKAQYVAHLEDRCRRAEAENVHLRKELELAASVRPSTFSPETTQATAELMQHLSTASDSLARFQQLALINNQQQLPSPSPTASTWSLRPASFPPPELTSPFSPTTPSFYPRYENHPRPEHFAKEIYASNTNGRQSPSPSPSLGDECCGGIIDCRHLVEEEQEGDEDSGSPPLVRMSGMRSTSDGTA